jgi:hypothetical protein
MPDPLDPNAHAAYQKFLPEAQAIAAGDVVLLAGEGAQQGGRS